MMELLVKRKATIIKIAKIISIIISLFLMMAGMIGFFSCAGDSGKHTEIYYECRAFGGEFMGIDIDKKGNIYVAEDIKDIIQVYDSTGKFLYGIECDANGGTFSFDNINNVLYISISRGDHVKVVNGLIYEVDDENKHYSMASIWENETHDYIFKSSGKIIKEALDGTNREIIELEGFEKEWHPMVYMSIYAIGFGLFGLGSGFFKYALDSTIEYCNKM